MHSLMIITRAALLVGVYIHCGASLPQERDVVDAGDIVYDEASLLLIRDSQPGPVSNLSIALNDTESLSMSNIECHPQTVLTRHFTDYKGCEPTLNILRTSSFKPYSAKQVFSYKNTPKLPFTPPWTIGTKVATCELTLAAPLEPNQYDRGTFSYFDIREAAKRVLDHCDDKRFFGVGGSASIGTHANGWRIGVIGKAEEPATQYDSTAALGLNDSSLVAAQINSSDVSTSQQNITDLDVTELGTHGKIVCHEESEETPFATDYNGCKPTLQVLNKNDYQPWSTAQRFLTDKTPAKPQPPPWAFHHYDSTCELRLLGPPDRSVADEFSYFDIKQAATAILNDCDAGYGGYARLGRRDRGWQVEIRGEKPRGYFSQNTTMGNTTTIQTDISQIQTS